MAARRKSMKRASAKSTEPASTAPAATPTRSATGVAASAVRREGPAQELAWSVGRGRTPDTGPAAMQAAGSGLAVPRPRPAAVSSAPSALAVGDILPQNHAAGAREAATASSTPPLAAPAAPSPAALRLVKPARPETARQAAAAAPMLPLSDAARLKSKTIGETSAASNEADSARSIREQERLGASTNAPPKAAPEASPAQPETSSPLAPATSIGPSAAVPPPVTLAASLASEPASPPTSASIPPLLSVEAPVNEDALGALPDATLGGVENLLTERGKAPVHPNGDVAAKTSDTQDANLDKLGLDKEEVSGIRALTSILPEPAAAELAELTAEPRQAAAAPSTDAAGAATGAEAGVPEVALTTTDGAPKAVGTPEEAAIAAPEMTAQAAPQAEVADVAAAAEVEGEAGEAPAEGAAPEAKEEEARVIEPQIPRPPASLGSAAKGRMSAAKSAAAGAAAAEATLPSAAENTAGARGAVTEPTEQLNAEAGNQLIAALEEKPAPSPEIEALCVKIYLAILFKRPADEDELVDADPKEAAAEAGGTLEKSIESEGKRVGEGYDELEQGAEAAPAEPGVAAEVPATTVATPDMAAEGAAPDPVPAEKVDLTKDVESSDAKLTDAGMKSEPAQLVQGGPIAEARAAEGELETKAKEDPQKVLAKQNEAIASAEGDMRALQAQALAALNQSRTSAIEGGGGQQTEMVGSEVQTRESVGKEANRLFTEAQAAVRVILKPLASTGIELWETGLEKLSGEFRSSLNWIKRKIEKRHEGIGGAVLSIGDAVAGLPDWVVEGYDKAEKTFGDDVCTLLRSISVKINSLIAVAQALIASARKKIDKLFADLPDDLKDWAVEQQAGFSSRLDGLQSEVTDAQDGFNKDLTTRAAGAVQDVRQEIAELRKAAGGLLGRIADAIDAFLEDPIRFIINGLLELVGIAPSAFWQLVDKLGEVISGIADDPLSFASNLMSAVKLGFENFFSNIGSHLLQGLLDWLFSGLGSVGVALPADTSLKNIITFFLQLMGLSWENIRAILVKHVGEENIALLERAYEFIQLLIDEGPSGIFEMIKEQLNPETIMKMVMDAAIDFMIEALITQVTARIVMLFNPVGAIAQAIEAIYRVLKWVFENAAKIFTLLETIVNGAWDIMNGNIGGMAAAVEKSLAGLIPPVIDFLADYVGLGGLPDKIADVIRGMQEWILGIVDKAIGFIVKKAKGLLASLGIGGEEPAEEDDGSLMAAKAPVDLPDGKHSIFLQGKEGAPQVWMASTTPQHLIEKVANLEDGYKKAAEEADQKAKDNPDSPEAKDRAANLGLLRQARTIFQKDARTVEAELKKAEKTGLDRDTVEKKLNKLAGEVEQMMKLHELLEKGGQPEVADSQVSHAGPDSGGHGTQTVAFPLTVKGPAGSPPGGSPTAAWKSLTERAQGGGAMYVRGHLLNENLHGPGVWKNMAPITTQANSDHKTGIENPVKTAVVGLKDDEAVYYSVKTEKPKIEKADDIDNSDPDADKRRALRKNEEAFVRSFVCDARTVKFDTKPAPEEKPGMLGGNDLAQFGTVTQVAKGTIVSTVESGVEFKTKKKGPKPKLKHVNLGDSGDAAEKAFAMIPGIGPKKAKTMAGLSATRLEDLTGSSALNAVFKSWDATVTSWDLPDGATASFSGPTLWTVPPDSGGGD